MVERFNFNEAELFEIFQKIQKKGVSIGFGPPYSYFDYPQNETPYVTWLQNIVFTQEVFDDFPNAQALYLAYAKQKLIQKFIDNIEPNAVLYLRCFPEYGVDKDIITGNLSVGLRFRFFQPNYRGFIKGPLDAVYNNYLNIDEFKKWIE